MSAVAAETAVADPAGGVENRMWKWRGHDIRYKVAAEVRKYSTCCSTFQAGLESVQSALYESHCSLCSQRTGYCTSDDGVW